MLCLGVPPGCQHVKDALCAARKAHALHQVWIEFDHNGTRLRLRNDILQRFCSTCTAARLSMLP